MKKLIASLAAVASAGLIALSTMAASAPVLGVGVQGIGPGYTNGTWMTASISRGNNQVFQFKVTNTGNVAETVHLLPTGAGGMYSPATSSGDIAAAQPASMLHNALSSTTLSLQPGDSATVTDTISVPSDAPLGLVPGNPSAPSSLRYNVLLAYTTNPPGSGGNVGATAAAGLRQYITVIN